MDNAAHIASTPNQVFVDTDVNNFTVDEQKITTLCQFLLGKLALSGTELSVQFVNPKGIQHLNQTFRGKDASTDVLSFPQMNFVPPRVVGAASEAAARPDYFEPLGDIVISLENAQANAAKIGHGLDRETAFLLIHGLLHLLGHDHEHPTEEEAMCAEQNKLLDALQELGSNPWANCVRQA